MPEISCPNVKLHYELSGNPDGRMLLLSNSLGTTLSLWEPQLTAFEKDFRVLRYDTRGHGASSTPSETCSIATLGEDVLTLLDELCIDSVDFCGISLGGAIGQWLGINAPQRINRLILCNTAARIGTLEAWNQRMEQVSHGGVASIADAVLVRWFTPDFFRDQPQKLAAMRSMLLETHARGYMSACTAIRDMDLSDFVGQIQAPVCIIAGLHDAVTTVDDAVWLQQHIPGSRLVVLPAAHISNVETAEQFNAAVLDFLR